MFCYQKSTLVPSVILSDCYVHVITILFSLYSSICSQGDRIEKLHQTSVDFLKKVVPMGHYVGIVTFSTSAYITAHLKEITSIKAREDLVENVPTTDDGGSTCIGSGLLKGLEVI